MEAEEGGRRDDILLFCRLTLQGREVRGRGEEAGLIKTEMGMKMYSPGRTSEMIFLRGTGEG